MEAATAATSHQLVSTQYCTAARQHGIDILYSTVVLPGSGTVALCTTESPARLPGPRRLGLLGVKHTVAPGQLGHFPVLYLEHPILYSYLLQLIVLLGPEQDHVD